mmetsp:Transcript_24293/g.56629  ORF Transcript_24293/g.56629 Transcript_24293/m.56629 type:complete len:193 (-) Transcript_24293:665-1243(-)|eukprot:CAMPEP_0116844398 /NCGR_PEP_ID=MMETSP0418-20121206/12661_1 /TAXON_ID=1158023 /ORGANISM="Astrosyne radiata, Strain 13vi08-1A" /LENGTH=192 /DNA_ID=CAMNT_0004475337 /DNA_START=96 /DNA_END=674 /DNA_ORIENTATION=+
MASPPDNDESKTEEDVSKLLPIRMISKVVRGFGRGSKDLGIPTANLCRESGSFAMSFDALPCGIYWGFARIGKGGNNDETTTSTTYKAAISIGYNPYYGNKTKTVEPHMIAPPQDERRHASSCGETVLGDFYDEPIRLSVVGYLRPELPFEGLDKLIEAIKKDIDHAEELGDGKDAITLAEREWVTSEKEIK